MAAVRNVAVERLRQHAGLMDRPVAIFLVRHSEASIKAPSGEPNTFWDRLPAGTQLRHSVKFFSQVLGYPESFGVDSKMQLLKSAQNLVNVVNLAMCRRKNRDPSAPVIKVGGTRVSPRAKLVTRGNSVRYCTGRTAIHHSPDNFRRLIPRLHPIPPLRLRASAPIRIASAADESSLPDADIVKGRVTDDFPHFPHLYGAHLPTFQTYQHRSPPI